MKEKISESEAIKILKEQIALRGGFIDQARVAELIRARDPSFKRDLARQLAKQLTGNEKRGPQTKRRKSAED